jgi:hypothetical protein
MKNSINKEKSPSCTRSFRLDYVDPALSWENSLLVRLLAVNGSMRKTLTWRFDFVCGRIGVKTAVMLSRMCEPKSKRCSGDQTNTIMGLISKSHATIPIRIISRALTPLPQLQFAQSVIKRKKRIIRNLSQSRIDN